MQQKWCLHVKTICILFAWEAACLQLSQDSGRAATQFFVLYMVCAAALLAQGSQGTFTMKHLLIEMFYEYAFNADIWFCTVKFMKVSFQERRRNRGWAHNGKGTLRNYVQGHCAQGVLKLLKNIAATVNSQEATGAYTFTKTLFFSLS